MTKPFLKITHLVVALTTVTLALTSFTNQQALATTTNADKTLSPNTPKVKTVTVGKHSIADQVNIATTKAIQATKKAITIYSKSELEKDQLLVRDLTLPSPETNAVLTLDSNGKVDLPGVNPNIARIIYNVQQSFLAGAPKPEQALNIIHNLTTFNIVNPALVNAFLHNTNLDHLAFPKPDLKNAEAAYVQYKDLVQLTQFYLKYPNPYLLATIKAALFSLNYTYYMVGGKEIGNWWPYEIGIPKRNLQIGLMLYRHLTTQQIDAIVNATRYYQPYPEFSGAGAGAKYSTSPKKIESQGANRIDTALVSFYRGALSGNIGEVERALAATSTKSITSFDPKTRDGFYPDGSFIQHGSMGYNGTYGSVLLSGLASFIEETQGTTLDYPNPNNPKYAPVSKLLSNLPQYYQYLFINNGITDAVSGRAPWKWNVNFFNKKASLKTPYDRVRSSSDLERGQSLSKVFKRLNLQIPTTDQNHYYYIMQKLVARNSDGGAVVLSLNSNRIANYETFNRDNPFGQYTNDGATLIYGKNPSAFVGYYLDADPLYIPGTTEVAQYLAPWEGSRESLDKASTVKFVGGVSLADNYQFIGFKYRNFNDSLTGYKSYVANRQGLVVFSSPVSLDTKKLSLAPNTKLESYLPAQVYTTIDQRRLDPFILANSKQASPVDTIVNTGKSLTDARKEYYSQHPVESLPPQVFADGKPIVKDVTFTGKDVPKQLVFTDKTGTKIGYQLYKVPNLTISFADGFVKFMIVGNVAYNYGIYPQTVTDDNYDLTTKVLNSQEQVFYDAKLKRTYYNLIAPGHHQFADFSTNHRGIYVVTETAKGLDLDLVNPELNPYESTENYVTVKVKGHFSVDSTATTNKVVSDVKYDNGFTTLTVLTNNMGKTTHLTLTTVK